MNIKAPSYLYKNRHGVFYFRVVIPKKYQQYFTHKREIKRSLRTENKHIALKLSRLCMVDFDKLLTEIKSGKRKTSELITIKDVQLPNGSTLGEISIDHGNATSEYETLMAIINSDSPDNSGNQSSNINTTSSINSSLTLSEVCDLYFEAKSIKDWSDTTYKENRAIFNLLEDLLGKATIFSSITRIDLTNAKNKLVKLPANLSKSKAYRDKTIDQILLMHNVKPMSINSIDKYLTRMSGLFGWAFIEGYISTNIAVKYSIGSNSNVARSPFSGTDLTSIFLPTNMLKFDKAYQFWVPIIALYSGARLNEICQLHLSDIQSINNIDVFVIQSTQKNQSTKNKASNRIVPIHSQVLQLGLLDYINFLKSKGQNRLFPELQYKTKGGYGDVVSKWFARYIKSIGVHVPNVKTFHSFRNTFIDHLKQKSVDKSFAAAIAGHTDKSITYDGHYAQAYNPSVLKPYVEMVNYNLKHIPFVINATKIKSSWK